MKTYKSQLLSSALIEIIQKSKNIATLFTRGDYATAQGKLVEFLDSIVVYFPNFSDKQKLDFTYFMKEVTAALERKDYYAVADFLNFELPYIISFSHM